MEARTIIRAFIKENFIVFGDEATTAFGDHDDIFKMGFVNSLFAMKLLNFVENEFGISIGSEDVKISNFNTVDNIANLIDRKLCQQV